MNMHTTNVQADMTLEQALARIKDLEGSWEDTKIELADAEGRIEELEKELSELEDRPDPESQVRELAQIRTTLKSGCLEDGRERLERVLGELDPAWRTFA